MVRSSSGGTHWFGHGGRVLTAVIVAALFASSTAWAQDKEWRLLFGTEPKVPATGAKSLALRPNVKKHPFYLFVQKGSAKETDVLVRLERVRVDEKGNVQEVLQLLAEKVVAVPGTEPVLVQFGETKPEPKPEPGKPAPPPPEPEFVPIPGAPPYTLRAGVHRPKAKPGAAPLAHAIVEVRLMAPSQYVKVSRPLYTTTAKGENRLVLEVAPGEGFHGPPAPVELVLLPELIDGLNTAKKSGNLKQDLPADGKIQLVAENLKFDKPPPELGVVALTVDGYPRAFFYAINFAPGDPLRQPKDYRPGAPTVRLLDDRKASVLVPKTMLRLQVDDAPSTDVRLEIGVDRNRNGLYEGNEFLLRQGERQQTVSVAPAGPGGAILFNTQVRDWQVELDTAGFYGKLPFRVRVLDKDGKALGPVDKPLSISTAGVTGHLVFDDTPPELVRFPDAKGFPRELARGERLRVEAAGEDLESDISEVAFFVGKPVKNKEGKLEPPPNTEPVKGAPAADKKGWWFAMLPGFERTGVVHLTAQFVNGAGQSAFESIEIRLVDPGAAGAGKKLFKISGQVVEGGRAQPGLDVVLKDDKGAPKAATKTGKDPKNPGGFTFENVPPGVYSVSSAKVGSNTKGEAPVTVEAADVKDVEISLLR